MSIEQDASKNGKKLFSVIVLGGFVLIAFAYWAISWLKHDSTSTSSAVNLNGTTSNTGTASTETPRYRELLRADNERGATQAARNNTTFIASLPVGLDNQEKVPTEKPAPQKKPDPIPSTPAAARNSSPTANGAGEKTQERLQKLLARINSENGRGRAPVTATVYASVAASSANVANTRSSSATLTRMSTSASAEQTLIPALTRVPGYLETAIDSDNPTSQVVAIIPAGTWAGARLHSATVKLAGEGVEIHFTRMSWRGMELNVDAYAQREDNLMSTVATDVNHRWGTHIVLPAILAGVGELGSLYKNTNTEILQTNVSTVTGRIGTPNASTVAGVFGGGVAEKGATVLTQEMAKEPYRQVIVEQNEVISILFVSAVSTGDTSNKGSSENSHTASLTAAPAVTEQQTEERLQSAIERRQAEIRRKYSSQ